ncbi:MAG: anti-sigma factor family protein [Pleomorphochaeta sp.]
MCLDDALLNSYLDGELQEPWKTQVEEHLSYCNGCQLRLNQLKELDNKLKNASFSDEDIRERSERVIKFFENNRFNTEVKKSFFKRKVQINLVPALLTSAAAVVVVFIGSFVLFGSNNKQTSEILPEVMMPIESNQVEQVSVNEKSSLDDYSLSEIIHYLDSQGYAVKLEVKAVNPLEDLSQDE